MTPNMDESYAAVDLGSNSFHMIVANLVDGRLQIIDRMKEMVRLAAGLNDQQELSEESVQQALECLQRFGQRIGEIPHVNVRAVGTNTLRQARNSADFLSQAHSALGHPIEIIAGREEARLVYSGVAHSLYDEVNKRLVVDIGGGEGDEGLIVFPHHRDGTRDCLVHKGQVVGGGGPVAVDEQHGGVARHACSRPVPALGTKIAGDGLV